MRKILYVDMDNVLVDFPTAIARLPVQLVKEYEGRLDEVPGIFSQMTPVPHAIESFEELAAIFDTYVLSTSSWENPSASSDKLMWVKRHLSKSAYKRLILSHHKNLNHGDYLVDDRTKVRTLRRRLTEENTSFQEVRDEVRFGLATEYLAATPLPLQEISTLLGYSDPGNFTHAFKRWAGKSPSDFRLERR